MYYISRIHFFYCNFNLAQSIGVIYHLILNHFYFRTSNTYIYIAYSAILLVKFFKNDLFNLSNFIKIINNINFNQSKRVHKPQNYHLLFPFYNAMRKTRLIIQKFIIYNPLEIYIYIVILFITGKIFHKWSFLLIMNVCY